MMQSSTLHMKDEITLFQTIPDGTIFTPKVCCNFDIYTSSSELIISYKYPCLIHQSL